MKLKPEERRILWIAANAVGLIILLLYMDRISNFFNWLAIAILVYCSAKRRAEQMDFEDE
jgi:hypothetical protein